MVVYMVVISDRGTHENHLVKTIFPYQEKIINFFPYHGEKSHQSNRKNDRILFIRRRDEQTFNLLAISWFNGLINELIDGQACWLLMLTATPTSNLTFLPDFKKDMHKKVA